MQRNVNAVFTAADAQAVISILQQAETKMPFLISLSNEERHELTKMGAKSAEFVTDSNDTVKLFPQIMPQSFDKTSLNKHTDLIKNLAPVQMVIDALQQKLNDTIMEIGSEAMNEALEVYSQVSLQKDQVPGLRSAHDKLKARFTRTKHKKAEEIANQ